LNKSFHETSIIDPSARIGNDVVVGSYSIVEADTEIGDGCRIDSHAIIASGARLGRNCKVFNGAVVGTVPQDLKFRDEKSEILIGDETVIREYCTLNRGTTDGGLVTRIGSGCLLMAYTHVAHDCSIGDRVILANGVNMAGHVTIEDHVGMSALVLIHQFVRIGQHAYIGGGSRVSQDVPPYVLVNGEPVRYFGPNLVGLKRHGFKGEQISAIKRAYQLIYRSGLNLTQAVDAIRSELDLTNEIINILGFMEKSQRGIAGR